MGCWQLAGRGWKGAGIAQGLETLETALESGVTLYDTAPIYGFGKSEELLGKTIGPYRKDITIATKCGLIYDHGSVKHDLSYDSVLRECEASLDRLRTDYIDLYQIHWPDPATPLEETAKALIRLQDEKVIRKTGVCNFSIAEIHRLSQFVSPFSLQAKYNYFEREVEDEILDFCAEENIQFVAYSPLAQGLLTPQIDKSYTFGKQDVRRLNPLFNNPDLFTEALTIKKELSEDPVKFSLEYLARNPNVSTILVGTANRKHLLEAKKYIDRI